MLERTRQTSHNLEAKPLPEFDRPGVAAHHKIELHGAKAAFLRALERMPAHRSRNSPPFRRPCRHVAAVRHVRASPWLIGPQEVGTENSPLLLPHEAFVWEQTRMRLPAGESCCA